MKAAYYEKYGAADVVTIRDIPRPEIGEDEVLVRSAAGTVTTADWRFRASAFPGALWLPGRLMAGPLAPRRKVLGSEFAGQVDSVGANVSRFKPGDRVFGMSPKFGAHAEYIAVPETGAIAHMPENLDFADAAALPFGAVCALVFLRDFAPVQPGQKVLVGGASGGVGVYGVQIAKHFGAEVTAVASARNHDLLTSLGADHVIDYRQQDVTRSGEQFDLVFDTAGTLKFGAVKRILKPNGIFLPLEYGLTDAFYALWTSVFGGKKLLLRVNGDRQADLEAVRDLAASGAVRAIIDSRYPLADIADAYRRVETRHKTGSVVIDMPAPGGENSAE